MNSDANNIETLRPGLDAINSKELKNVQRADIIKKVEDEQPIQ